MKKEFVETIQTVGIVAGLFFSGFSFWHEERALRLSNEVASADYILRLNDHINNQKYNKISSTIENNPTSYSLLKNNFSRSVIEGYIGEFETIGDLAKDGVIEPRMAYDEFGDDLEKIWCNTDVQNIIKEDRSGKEKNSPNQLYYEGLEFLARQSLKMDKIDCSSKDLN